jgi:hypothetical protein
MNRSPVLVYRQWHREAVRYKLQLPAVFSWNDGAEYIGAGLTSDVSLDGASIISTICPPIGTDVRIDILLPSPDQSGEGVRIQCTAKVARLLDEWGLAGFCVDGTFDDDHLTAMFWNGRHCHGN